MDIKPDGKPAREYWEDDDDVVTAHRLLPAWFVPRMMCDEWSFGLLLDTGHVLCIQHIDKVTAGLDGVWIDATMMGDGDEDYWIKNCSRSLGKAIHAPTSRLTVSINAKHVVAAFELADT